MTSNYFKSIRATLLGIQEKKQPQNERFFDWPMTFIKKFSSLMQSGTNFNRIIKTLVITICLVVSFCFVYNSYKEFVIQKQILGKTQEQNVDQKQNEVQAIPFYLKIPAIDVDTTIEQVGVANTEEMEVPSLTTVVGWFNLGPRPGEKGSAVIAGHLNNEDGHPGVFADLHKLKIGDKLYVQDSHGVITTFIVKKLQMYDPGYADEVFLSDNGTHLNLITCDGSWNRTKRTYSKRLVVFTDISK